MPICNCAQFILRYLIRKTLSGTKDKLDTREITYTYYPNNLLDTTTDSSGGYSKNYYDRNGNVTKTMSLRDDGEYDIRKYEYDVMNRVTRDIRLADMEDIFNASSMAGINDLMDPEYPGMIRLVTAYEYDILGNLIKEMQPKAFEYAAADAQSRDEYTIRYSYDALNRLERTTRKHEGSDVYTENRYDEVGNRIAAIDEMGRVTTYAYDSMNRLESSTDALGNTFSFTYDLAGNKTSETNALGSVMTYTYDRLNRLETTIDPYGVTIKINTYNQNGNIVRSRDAKGNETTYAYNLVNMLVEVAEPEEAAMGGWTTKYEYNQYGEKTAEIDGLGNTTSYAFDKAGRLVRVTDALGISIQHAYDKAGNKMETTDGRGKASIYTYGAFGMMTSMTDAEGNTSFYSYDLMGNRAGETDRNGNILVYAYNNRGLLTEKINANTGDAVSFSYDAMGNRTGMTDESGSYSYSYDPLNRLLERRRNGSLEISYTYDAIGNIRTVTDAKGNVTSYTYDKSSRMETVSFAGNTVTYTYDLNGNRESITYPGGIREEYVYDRNNRLISLSNKKPDGNVISFYSYTYDAAGRQATKTDSLGTTFYSYDDTGRITRVEAPGKTAVYAYDKAGNRVSQIETYTSAQPSGFVDSAAGEEVEYILKTSRYVYSDADRLLRLSEEMSDGSNKTVLMKDTQYLYDANGNQLGEYSSHTRPNGGELRRSVKASVYGDNQASAPDVLIDRTINTFDGFNRLKEAETICGGVRTLVGYIYNGDDLRTQKTVRKSDNGYTPQTTSFIYDRQHVILETDANGNASTSYVRGINYIAQRISGEYAYYLYNGHGDVVQTISVQGEVYNRYDYDIFGNPTLTVEQYSCSIRYAGEYLDSETGLYYLRARYYDPYTGRFISEDSFWGEDSNPLSLNLYTYAFNNPIRYVDPTGHSPEDDRIAQQRAIAQMDALKRIHLQIASGNIPLDCYGVEPEALLKAVEKTANQVRDQLLGYESNENLRGLISQDKEGKVGAWEEYRLRKTEERIVQQGYISVTDRELVKRQSIALTLAVNTGKPVVYNEEKDLDELIYSYRQIGWGITRDDIYEIIEEGKELSEKVTWVIEKSIWWNSTSSLSNMGKPPFGWSYDVIVTRKEIRGFIRENNLNLTDVQVEALKKINDYTDNEVIKGLNKEDPIILFFEGAGDYKGRLKEGSSGQLAGMHSKGRFGAMAIVVINGKIEFMSTNASTLPDNPHDPYKQSNTVSTVKPGVYHIQSDYSGGGTAQKYVGFATGTKYGPSEGKGDQIDTYRLKGNLQGEGCDIHPGWDEVSTKSSTGCITIMANQVLSRVY